MKRPWPIIAVADVVRSTEWYMKLLDAQQNHPGSTIFNQIQDDDGAILLCLHRWGPSGPRDDHEWPSLADPGKGTAVAHQDAGLAILPYITPGDRRSLAARESRLSGETSIRSIAIPAAASIA